MPGEGRGLSSRPTQDVVRDLEIGQPSNSESVQKLPTASHAKRRREVLSESRMREIRMSGSMSGCGNGASVEPVRHRQTKGRQQMCSAYSHRATLRLYPIEPIRAGIAERRLLGMTSGSRRQGRGPLSISKAVGSF